MVTCYVISKSDLKKSQFPDKTYQSIEEETKRLGIYLKNLELINNHNAAGKHTYQLAMNHLGDLLQEEISGILNGYVPSSDEVVDIFLAS